MARTLRAVAVLFVLLLAAWIRWDSLHGTVVEVPIRADAAEYVAYAYNLETHGVYSDDATWRRSGAAMPTADAKRPPGYPLFLAAFLEGPPDEAFELRVRKAQAVLGFLTVAASMLLAYMLLSFCAALALGALLALTPQLVIYESYLLSETLYAFVIATMGVALASSFVGATSRKRLFAAMVFGLLLGASILVRPTLLYLPLLLIPFAFLPRLNAARPRIVAVVLACAAVLSPWLAYNVQAFGRLSDPRLPIGTLQAGSYPGFVYENDPRTFGRPVPHDPRTPEISRDTGTVLTEIGSKFAAEPLRFAAWYAIGKPYYFLSLHEVAGWGWVFIYPVLHSPFLEDPFVRLVSAVMTGLHWPLVILTLLGAVFVWLPSARARGDADALAALRALSVLFAFVVAIHVVGTPLPRYSVPFRPWTMVLAMFAAGWAYRWMAARRAHSRATWAARQG